MSYLWLGSRVFKQALEAFGILMLKYTFSHILETLFLSFLTFSTLYFNQFEMFLYHYTLCTFTFLESSGKSYTFDYVTRGGMLSEVRLETFMT